MPYRIYKHATHDSTPELIATTSAVTYLFTGAPNTTQLISVRAVSPCGVEDVDAAKRVRVAFDGSGNLIGPTPNAPIDVVIKTGAGGAATVSWAYLGSVHVARPASFNVYVATGNDAFDFGAADYSKTYSRSREFSQSLGAFAHGTRVRVIVASVASGGAERRATAVEAIVDAQAPDPASDLDITVTAG